MRPFLRQGDKFADVVCGCSLRMLFADVVWGIGCKVVARIGWNVCGVGLRRISKKAKCFSRREIKTLRQLLLSGLYLFGESQILYKILDNVKIPVRMISKWDTSFVMVTSLWMLFVHVVCGRCLRMLFVDVVCGCCLRGSTKESVSAIFHNINREL